MDMSLCILIDSRCIEKEAISRSLVQKIGVIPCFVSFPLKTYHLEKNTVQKLHTFNRSGYFVEYNH